MPKVHNDELAKQWSLTLLSMYYLLQTTRFNRWFTYMRKLFFLKLYSKYEKIQLMGYFWSPLIVMLNTVKSMMAVLVSRSYDVYKCKASLGTAKRSRAPRNYWGYIHARFRVRLGPGLTFFLPRGIALQLAFQNSRRELPWAMLQCFITYTRFSSATHTSRPCRS